MADDGSLTGEDLIAEVDIEPDEFSLNVGDIKLNGQKWYGWNQKFMDLLEDEVCKQLERENIKNV